MELSRVFLLAVSLFLFITYSLATSNSCAVNERNNPAGSCHMTCNGCRDCGPCQCKPGYIRAALGQECIKESQCHALHSKWMHDAKYEGKHDKFFKCDV